MGDAALLILALAAVACAREKPIDATWHDEAGYSWRELDVPQSSRGKAGFKPLTTEATGITHRNDVADENALKNRNLIIGAGVAAGDVDGDGLPDVFLASVERPAALYRNTGGNRFVDITASSGIETKGLATTSAVFADVNGDDRLDLVVGTLGGPVKLWIGDGRGHFADSSANLGLTGAYAVTTMTLADIDGDGDLDLYVGTYKTHNALDVYPPQQRTFDQIVKKVRGVYKVADEWASEYRLTDRPDLGGLMQSQRAEPDLFLLNDGKGHFERERQTSARFTDEDGRRLIADPDYFTLAARFYDVNGDGAPDLYVCNDFDDPDQFWINDGKGNFRLTPWLSLRETSILCMSVDFADINRDGHVDFFTADMMSPTLEARQRQFPINTPQPKTGGLPKDRQQWMRNTLQLGRGDDTWASIGDFAGVTATDWTWGTAFLDVDLDGYEDLLAANGHRWDVRDADSFERIRNSFPRVSWSREQAEFPKSATRSFAFRNNGDVTFTDMSRAWRFGSDEAISQGIALADFDGDGDLDVIVTRLDAPPMLYRNDTPAPRIAVRLAGEGANRNGIGARVTISVGSLPAQSREMTAGGYYLSGSDAQLTFAMGRDSSGTIEVRWRSGRVSTIANARANRLYEIRESSAQNVAAATLDSTGGGLFEDATALLGGHTHTDSLFDDYARQPLLPNRLSQLGPGVTWFDADEDGRSDLAVGTGRGGRLSVLRNARARFSTVTPPGAPASWDLTTVLPVPDGRGGTALVAGQSNYEAGSANSALAVPSVVSFAMRGGRPQAAAPLLPADSASVGPLALADVNGDGRLDLFVGARAIPGAWPLPAPSRLYLRTADGGWARDTVNAKTLAGLGLVSAALFTDLDNDAYSELVVTSEWGPVRVFHNDRGVFRDVTREWGLATSTSRWNGLAAGDFDGDGRMDLTVTSWGRNTPWKASNARPYTLVAGNFGAHGLALLFARRDSVTGKEMPLQSLERIAIAVPATRSHFATFAEFSRATMDEVLGDASRSAVRVGATTFDHLVLLNRGGHFEARPLPAMAQLAPAFAPVVADFDGDGREDVFLAQNFSATEIDTPLFHAGVGLVLLGDGRGDFRPLSVAQSGIRVFGDQRGAAVSDYDGDGRVDLAVSQNGAKTTLWHNRRGAPGLRVRVNAGRDNPNGIGAQLRVSNGTGPVREIHAGSAYWSMDDPTTVMALPPNPQELWVRWPGGLEQRVPLASGQREITVSR